MSGQQQQQSPQQPGAPASGQPRLGSLTAPPASPGSRLGALRPAGGLSVRAAPCTLQVCAPGHPLPSPDEASVCLSLQEAPLRGPSMSGGGSRLGAAVASLGVGALPAVGGGGHAAPPRAQFAPRVPADRPRSKAPQGQAGPSVPGGTPASLEPQFAALLARTQEDSARLDARRSGGRQGQAAAPGTLRKTAAQDGAAGAPGVAFGPTPPAAAAKAQSRGVKVQDDHAGAGPATAVARAADAPPGETAKRKSRTPAKDKAGQAAPGAPPKGGSALAPHHPVDEDADSSDDGESMDVDGAAAAAPPGMPAWADPSREYPITLPFPEPAAVDLADVVHRQDGRLFLMQLPVCLA